LKRIRYENGKIDSIDIKLIDALIKNARISNAELGRLTGLSAPTVAEGVKRLEEVGIIEGYSANINPQALGLPISAWIRIRPIPGQMRAVLKIVTSLPEIISCDRVTGEDCFVARAYVISIEDLERVIDQIIPHAMTNTSIIQSSPVKRGLPPIKDIVK
jgi:Lrp/AsnC family leucine-responsive transcriptional regulator